MRGEEMRILVTGAGGALGSDMLTELVSRGNTVFGSFHREAPFPASSCRQLFSLDVTDRCAVLSAFDRVRPEAVIHCAAWTNVDAAELHPEECRRVNADGTAHVAEGCAISGAKLLYLSTDYVFDGTGSRPWQPDMDLPHPLNCYGQSKLDGENAIRNRVVQSFIVRTSWLFGRTGRNFVKTMLALGKSNPSVRVVCDQIGTPTYTVDLARLLADMIETDKYGCYHVSNSEASPGAFPSRAEFCREIFHQAGLSTAVVPVKTADFQGSTAVRPLNSRLDKSKLLEAGFQPLPDWKDALNRYYLQIGENRIGSDPD